MSSQLLTLEQASQLLTQPGAYLVAADANVLCQLPKGNWIGGSIPYFIAEEGGVVSQNRVFVTKLPEATKIVSTQLVSEADMPNVYRNMPENGFGVIILPATSPSHLSFALNAPSYEDFAMKPLVGWISGVHLSELGKTTPTVFDGRNGRSSESDAVLMYLDLDADYVCDMGIVNIFTQGGGDTLEFPETSFSVKDVLVNGVKQNFAEYLKANKVDIKNPLVANYAGAMINVSFQGIDEANQIVNLYAPVFQGAEYKLADPIQDYVGQFTSQMPKDSDSIAFSCNCILNFLYSELEGKKTGNVTGPITFGEVAFQLLNQTMVYLTLEKI
ncbi:MAG: hypothetical protein JST12_02390 [Armatimonadetes bacterium]|nr:hypothetical protein [Armatimonadota bacterium]MBS1725254.1 hypothetical protein [Armatimonadota bacterium]